MNTMLEELVGRSTYGIIWKPGHNVSMMLVELLDLLYDLVEDEA